MARHVEMHSSLGCSNIQLTNHSMECPNLFITNLFCTHAVLFCSPALLRIFGNVDFTTKISFSLTKQFSSFPALNNYPNNFNQELTRQDNLEAFKRKSNFLFITTIETAPGLQRPKCNTNIMHNVQSNYRVYYS